jgi:processive 1,2-diacylglycerol beta-glucosyltransferase
MYITEISGHHSATLAIEKAIKKLSPDTKVLNINAFNYTNPISEKIINRLYMGVIKKAPGIWDYLYDNPAVIKSLEKIKKAVHKLNSPKLKVLFDEFKPHVVACSQAFPCGMVADFKKYYNSRLPLVAMLTDYIPHSYWLYDNVDYYIAPSEEVAQRLINNGIAPDKIKPFGIPIDPKFKEEIKLTQLRQKFNLNPDKFTILIMGGGQGLGPIKKVVKSLETIPKEFQEIIVTGSNNKLYTCLKKKIKKYKKHILLFKYSNNINELMGISDLIITKPGGITTAEVLTKRLPMIIIHPIPGQEESNTVYLTKEQAAIRVDEPQDTGAAVENLLLHPEKLKHLSESAQRISKPSATLDIARLLLDLAGKNV